MRPKKVILLVEGDEAARSVRTFLLKTWGFRVVAVETATEALEVLGRPLPLAAIDLLLVADLMPNMGSADMQGNELVRRGKEMHFQLRTALVSERCALGPEALAADVFLPQGHKASELLQWVRLLVRRKSGPIPWRGAVRAGSVAVVAAERVQVCA